MNGQPLQSNRAPARRVRWTLDISIMMAVMGFAAASVTATAGDGASAHTAHTAHTAGATTVAFSRLSAIPSHNGIYRASLVPLQKRGRTSEARTWTVELQTATGLPVENATLALESWMPDDDGVPTTRPRVTGYLGQGRYRVDGLGFTGHGWWNVRLQIEASVGNDSLAFNLVR